MLKRINEIISVGNFYNFKNGSKFQFEKFTLIYGLNTYGKSTIVDIINSLTFNSPDRILDKTSIGSTSKPKVSISFKDDDQPEQQAIFNNVSWQGYRKKFDIQIFDIKYISDNVLTGLEITRDNKQNMTEFILGEENVKLANEISQIKKEARESNTKIKAIEKNLIEILKKEKKIELLPEGKEIEEFLKLTLKEGYQHELNENIRKKEYLEKNLRFAHNIINIEDIKKISLDVDIMLELKRSNELLKASCEDINNEAYNKILSHIQKNFSNSDANTESWIKEGTIKYLSNSDSSKCPYCGQAIQDAKELISIYKKYFSETYTYFSENTIKELRECYRKIEKVKETTSKSNIKDILIELKSQLDFISDEEYKNSVNELCKEILKLNDILSMYNIELNNILKIYVKNAETKKLKPYESINCIDLNKIEKLTDEIKEFLIAINTKVEKINKSLNVLKDSLKDDTVVQEFNKVNKAIDELKIIELKEKWIEKIKEHTELIKKAEEQKKAVTERQNKLKSTMDDFLSKYFDKINYYLNKFGTKNFQIERNISTNGDMPVITLNVKFKGHEISEKKLKNVLSESDIRALALSIFWAKITVKEKQALSNTIIVLDDPITSFDSNRVRLTIDEIFNLHQFCRQIILLSHYENFISLLYSCNNGVCNIKLLRITRDNATSFLEDYDSKEFVLDKHDKLLEKIDDYIDAKDERDISGDLRKYFENEIKRRYRYHINKLNLEREQMKNLVQTLNGNKIISDENKDKILSYLRILNPEHHVYTISTPEEWRTFAADILKFLFYSLNNVKDQSA